MCYICTPAQTRTPDAMRELCRVSVDSEIKDRFVKRFGNEYGLLSFTLETAMRELLDVSEGQPDMEELVRQSIRVHVLKNQYHPQRVANER